MDSRSQPRLQADETAQVNGSGDCQPLANARYTAAEFARLAKRMFEEAPREEMPEVKVE